MKPTLQKIDAISAVGIQGTFISGASPRFNGFQVIPPLWQELNKRRDDIPHSTGQRDVGAAWHAGNKSDPEEMFYLAGTEVTSASYLPEGMVKLDIPEGNYAVFTHKGKLDNFLDTMRYIYGVWLPTSGQVVRPAPHLELYDDRFVYNSDSSELDIAVPIV